MNKSKYNSDSDKDFEELLLQSPVFKIKPRWKLFLRGLYYGVYYGIRNIIYWFPIIWKDRSDDHVFIFSILKHKLIKVKYQFDNLSSSVEAPKRSKDINVCINILDRLINEDYRYLKRCAQLKKVDYGKALDFAEEVRKNELKLLFKIMGHKVLYWWD